MGISFFFPFNGGRNRGSESLNNLSFSKLIMKVLGFRPSTVRFHSLCSCTFITVLPPASQEEQRREGVTKDNLGRKSLVFRKQWLFHSGNFNRYGGSNQLDTYNRVLKLKYHLPSVLK